MAYKPFILQVINRYKKTIILCFSTARWDEFIKFCGISLIVHREAVAEYCVAAKMAEITLTEAIFESLGMKRASMDQILVKLEQNVSFNYYPTCEKSNLEHTVGLRGHTDPSIITMLLSDEVPGLEIFQNGEWILFKPLPNTLSVNVGDILQVIFFPPCLLFTIRCNNKIWR